MELSNDIGIYAARGRTQGIAEDNESVYLIAENRKGLQLQKQEKNRGQTPGHQVSDPKNE